MDSKRESLPQLPDVNSVVVRIYDGLFGKFRERIYTTIQRPESADLMGYCYDCRKWTWLIGSFCSECGQKNFFG